MVKGENDIVEDWVKYHGEIFGYENIYIIDNYSLDGTYETLVKLKSQYKINITRLNNYKNKGKYMTILLRNFCNNDIGFPIDIDEFIVYYDSQTNKICCEKHIILNYIKTLPVFPVYKMNYIWSKILNSEGYNRATVESTYGDYRDYKSQAKTFFNTSIFKGEIDHGNHFMVTNYILTKLCLVHFHSRNLDQMKKKVFNNIIGLGYQPFKLNELKKLAKINGCEGIHHINNQIDILENNYKLPIGKINNNDISLEPLNNFIINLKST